MLFLIKRVYVTVELATDESDVKDKNDLPYVIHKKLQHFDFMHIASSTKYLTQVYIRENEKQNWRLAFESESSEPENEPLK